MDMVRIGKFLAELRRESGLTQEQLGEKLGVTNKTISRWENGNYLPPVEMIQLMSKLYDVSINEILSGERLTPEDYREKAEENMAAAIAESSFSVREKAEYHRRKWTREHFTATFLVYLALSAGLLTGIILDTGWIMAVSASGIFLWHIIRYNQMMAYVENHAYDGTGSTGSGSVDKAISLGDSSMTVRYAPAMELLHTFLLFALCVASAGYILFCRLACIIPPVKPDFLDVAVPLMLTFSLYLLLSRRTELSAKQKTLVCAAEVLLTSTKYTMNYLICMSDRGSFGIESPPLIIIVTAGIHLIFAAAVLAVSVLSGELLLRRRGKSKNRRQTED